ncbi:OLC1v1034923C1 [Oldenlandia corymbosa var. corymbosa]|uniref:OLC1v1034923C1 n=1 Tax=Oldenlandia corymbosa var. corymbosa TaxID=529605 RepID=A0AAV1CSC9_OLDCO|nr:OLC1v1034923C1 [Oldenlandia corymbosa var. corymbosa]
MKAAEVPEDFPFTIQDLPGWRTVVLERKFQGENVTVLVDIPTSAADHTHDDNADKEPSVPWAIIASKEKGSLLHVKGRFFPGRISVEELLVNKIGDSDNGVRYAGPNFLKLDESVQHAIYDYLEARGMTSNTADFVIHYMLGKDANEYLRWLRKLKVLIE